KPEVKVTAPRGSAVFPIGRVVHREFAARQHQEDGTAVRNGSTPVPVVPTAHRHGCAGRSLAVPPASGSRGGVHGPDVPVRLHARAAGPRRMRAGQATAPAVLLDMDGTLIRSEHVHRAVWQRFFTAWQVEM